MPRSRLHEQYATLPQQRQAYGFGVWAFLASEVMFFSALFVLYGFYRMMYGPDFARGAHETDLRSGTIGTYLLASSSFTMAMGLFAVRRGSKRWPTVLLGLTALFAAAFLALEFSEWRHDFHKGIMPGRAYSYAKLPSYGAKLFFTEFFFLTGLHGLHVFGGLVVICVLFVRSAQGAFSPEHHTALEAGGLFWHFVDVMWFFIWSLLYLSR